MIECSNEDCMYKRWFHYRCLGIEPNTISENDEWYCPYCVVRIPSKVAVKQETDSIINIEATNEMKQETDSIGNIEATNEIKQETELVVKMEESDNVDK